MEDMAAGQQRHCVGFFKLLQTAKARLLRLQGCWDHRGFGSFHWMRTAFTYPHQAEVRAGFPQTSEAQRSPYVLLHRSNVPELLRAPVALRVDLASHPGQATNQHRHTCQSEQQLLDGGIPSSHRMIQAKNDHSEDEQCKSRGAEQPEGQWQSEITLRSRRPRFPDLLIHCLCSKVRWKGGRAAEGK